MNLSGTNALGGITLAEAPGVVEASNLKNRRGITARDPYAVMNRWAVDKDGEVQSAQYQIPLFTLTVDERLAMFQRCAPIFGVVTGRMNRVAGMAWRVVRHKKEEDRIAQVLKENKQIFDEFDSDDPHDLGIRIKCLKEIFRYLPDVKMDLSNFDNALLRWSRRINSQAEDKCSEIEDWLRQPNQEQTFEDLIKEIVFDLHIHGNAVPYKEVQRGRIENIYCLAGGSTVPVTGQFVGDPVAYLQLTDTLHPQLYYQNEVEYLRYAPNSNDPYGSVPLEALVNKVAESLMFDERCAEMADGSNQPSKLLAFGDNSVMGAIGEKFDTPMDKNEQKRLEAQINEYRKEAIRIITGHGVPVAVDVSRADTFGQQNERQKMIREEVGVVFGASNMELNLSGSDNTSGRQTSETQERYDLYKGIFPTIQNLENFWNLRVLPFRYGSGYEFKYDQQDTDAKKIREAGEKLQTGLYSVNEIRTKDLGEDAYPEEQFNRPNGAQLNLTQDPLSMMGGMDGGMDGGMSDMGGGMGNVDSGMGDGGVM